MSNNKFLFLTIVAGVCLTQSPMAMAQRGDLDAPLIKHKDNMKGEGARLQEYDEIVSPTMESAWSVANRARSSLKNGNVSRALSLAQRAMRMDDDDMDIHLIYAEAMTAKIERQTDRDPELFKKCLHEWLLVYRNEVGMEKGMTFKGLNPVGNMYNDDEHGNLAKKNLIRLTGYAPKLWETDNHFLTRVTREADTSVSAKIRPATSARASAAAAEEEEEEQAPPPRRKAKSTAAAAEAEVNVDDEETSTPAAKPATKPARTVLRN